MSGFALSSIADRLRTALSARAAQEADGTGLRLAAVLLLVYQRAGADHILLTKRTSRVDDHKGEISFPGGSFHPGEDRTLLDTALREGREEVGLEVGKVEVLGAMDHMVTVSRYLVAPFVATLRQPQVFVPQPSEVAEVLEAPLSVLRDPANQCSDPTTYEGRPVVGPYYLVDGHVVWGATGRLLRVLLSHLGPEW